MMGSSREGYQAKKERDATINIEKFSKASSSTSTTRQWSAFRNARIVRVSRSFGGKDRHSKVCTIRGLRDRRIRLSVPTAIQLYDLQDKLGLSQPSKVVDWLLEATKFDIEKLPPLQFPHGFSQFQFHQTLFPIPSATATTSTRTLTPSFFDGGAFQVQNLVSKKARNIWDLDGEIGRVKGKWVKSNEEEQQEEDGEGGGYNNNNNLHDFVATQKLFPSHQPFLPSLPNSNNNPMSSNNLSLSQFGLFPSQVDPNLSNASSMQFPSSNSFAPLASANSQLLFGPPSSSLFTTPYAPLENNDTRQFNQIQFLNSASHHYPLIHSFNSTVKPFPAPFNSKLLDSVNNNRSQEDRDSTRNS